MADRNDAMNDQAIDRALREALDVSPSPDFVARVRMRIANEPAPRGLWSRWMVWTPVAAGALVAAAVVIAVVVGGPKQAGDTVRLRPDATSEQVRVKPDATSERVRLKPDTTLSRRTATPEVLIAQDEAAALRRLFARAGEGLVSGGSPVADAGAATDTAGVVLPPDITIAPLKIEPLVPVNREEGVRQ